MKQLPLRAACTTLSRITLLQIILTGPDTALPLMRLRTPESTENTQKKNTRKASPPSHHPEKSKSKE